MFLRQKIDHRENHASTSGLQRAFSLLTSRGRLLWLQQGCIEVYEKSTLLLS